MMDCSYSMEERGMQGSMLGESLMWEPEMVLFDSNVDVSTLNNDGSAPINFGGLDNNSGKEHGTH